MAFQRAGCWTGMLLLGGMAVFSCRRPDYFPLKNDQAWHFAGSSEVNAGDGSRPESLAYSIAVTGSATEAGLGMVYEVRITRDDEPYMMLFVRKTRDAVYVLPASHLDGLEPTSGWIKFLELPLREDKFWYGDAEHSVSFEVMAREDRETPAGWFRNCYPVRIHAPLPYAMTVWLAPDAGVVRWVRRFSASRSERSELVRRRGLGAARPRPSCHLVFALGGETSISRCENR